jgi:rfaE bifunctional protein nucleotidyltransferase chain/domain
VRAEGSSVGRVLGRPEVIEERKAARVRGKTFVFTNGCFDLLHRGHVELLRASKALGDLLCVGINTDASVRRLKGARRPLVPEGDRLIVVAALEAVDFVTLFDEDTPEQLISLLVPDVLVKGSDYAMDAIVGRSDVERAGGRVVRVPLYGELSTEKLAREIALRYKEAPPPGRK